jgi:hypothetical protein
MATPGVRDPESMDETDFAFGAKAYRLRNVERWFRSIYFDEHGRAHCCKCHDCYFQMHVVTIEERQRLRELAERERIDFSWRDVVTSADGEHHKYICEFKKKSDVCTCKLKTT